MERLMRSFYQKSWLGIDFESFAVLSEKKVAGKAFYESFYKKFFEKYSSFEELPDDWKKAKESIANNILEQAKDSKYILSIGCGIGYVESLLSRKFSGTLAAIEPSENNVCRWLTVLENIKFFNGYFPEALPQIENPDFCFFNALDYVFSQKEFIDFLKKLRVRKISKVVLYSASFYQESFWFKFKYNLKLILSKLKILSLGQFWGFQRTANDYRKAFLQAGFETVSDGFLANGTFWISGE